MSEPDWIAALRAACRQDSQVVVARRLNYSAGAVSAVLKGTYKADTKRLEQAVRGVLLAETVPCPVLAEIGRDVCLRTQSQPFAVHGDPIRLAMRRICPTCRFHLGQGAAADEG